MNKKFKTIGILGGMGPAASADLYLKIVKYGQKKYGFVQDSDFPPIVLLSLTLSGFDETGVVDKNLVLKQLMQGVKKLESMGADFIVIACNTVHIFYKEMQNAVNIPILDIVEETRKAVEKNKFKKIGLLASQTTTELGLYCNNFKANGLEVVSATNDQQKLVNNVIENVMGGRHTKKDTKIIKDISVECCKKGAEAIVLGCTEIPLAINQSHIDVKLFDATQILAEAAVDFAFKH